MGIIIQKVKKFKRINWIKSIRGKSIRKSQHKIKKLTNQMNLKSYSIL
jgi:hypothetical protein